jgi:hypothetical protein
MADGKCFNCDAQCDEDMFCPGCNEYVCSECSLNYSLMGAHEPEAHLEEEPD